jgi:MarR family transcriptional regulator, 2-MHQ and catechol-resistance regulon repressor
MIYFDIKYIYVKVISCMARVQPRPLSSSLAVPSDISGVHIWLILMKAYRALAYQAEQSIVGLGFCFSDFATLEVLLHKGPHSVTEIAHRIGLTAGSMSIALDRLERRGLIRRHAHPTDRRNRVIHLTGAGKKLIENAFQEHASVMEEISKSLSPEQRAVLIELLKRLGKGAEELSPRTVVQVQPLPVIEKLP